MLAARWVEHYVMLSNVRDASVRLPPTRYHVRFDAIAAASLMVCRPRGSWTLKVRSRAWSTATWRSAACSGWREINRGRLGQEVEGWPCSAAAKRQSGHPKVANQELRKVLAGAGMDSTSVSGETQVKRSSGDLELRLARARGLLRAALVREDALFADEALGVLGRLQHHRGLKLSEAELESFAKPLLQRALRWHCPTDDEAAEELASLRRSSTGPKMASDRSPLSLLATELIPQWLEEATEATQTPREDRLRMAADSWSLVDQGGSVDVEGTVLMLSVFVEICDESRLRQTLDTLLDAGVDLRLALQPAFLRRLEDLGLVQQSPPNRLADLVQHAACLATRGEAGGVFFRRHGALLLDRGRGEPQILARGFNHFALPLGPRGPDPQSGGKCRTFESFEEARSAGLSWKRSKPRTAQRHAEVHCLLQVPELLSLSSRKAEMLIVELADIGPGFNWAEPCSRGCMQLLMKYGVQKATWTDGRGSITSRPLRHESDLDVAAKTYAGTSRLSCDAISERACVDIDEKLQQEGKGLPPLGLEELVEQGAQAAEEARRREPLRLRGQVFPLPPRKRNTEYSANGLADAMNATRVRSVSICDAMHMYVSCAVSRLMRTEAPALPLDLFLRRYFQAHKFLDDKDRAWIADKTYEMQRWRGLIDHLTPQPHNWVNRMRTFFMGDRWRAQSQNKKLPHHVRCSFPSELFKRLEDNVGTKEVLSFVVSEELPETLGAKMCIVESRKDAITTCWVELRKADAGQAEICANITSPRIYIAKDSEQCDREVALKLEDTKHPQLIYEAKLLKLLQGSPGVAEIFFFGFEEDFAVMAMELMGPSLEDVFNLCKRKLSLKSTLMLADQLLLRIEHFHRRHYIHRDIKPDNFLIGRGQKSNLVYIIDFGLAKKYRNPETLVHGPYRENKNLTGTARYASLNAHLGIEQSRRDDLEAIGFVLVYFLKGSLPWQGIKAEGKHDKYAAIMEMKIKMTFAELCQGLPEEFATFLSYARLLAFDEDPDYRYMRWLFKSLYHREGFRNDGCFDWNVVRARPPSEVAERREARLRRMSASLAASQPSDRGAEDVVLSFRYFEIQDESSQIISAQVDAKPGDMVMDYCAGSGGKAPVRFVSFSSVVVVVSADSGRRFASLRQCSIEGRPQHENLPFAALWVSGITIAPIAAEFENCASLQLILPGEPTDADAPRYGEGPSLMPPMGEEENDEQESESEDESMPQLPAGGMFTVMMFGMTGAGKSAIGNLLAGCEAFASGDDTASVTNLDSVMRFQAHDDSFIVLDTIGLGDTEIDQDKVVSSIRDVALSAVNGVDAMCFVMRNARITDDAIARLIYVTEFLWGTECLLNLYVVVTFASRYLASREDANQWIERQVELNWRFKHIYDLVGQNPYRFIFIDNPSIDSGEPNVEERQAASKRALMTAFTQHPRDVIPPFTHAVMQKAKQLVAEEAAEMEKAAAKVQEVCQKKKKKRRRSRPQAARAQSNESANMENAEVVKEALEERKKAQENLHQALIKVKTDADFQREVAKEAELATLRFGQAYQNQLEATDLAQPSPTASTSSSSANSGNPVQACKRMFISLVNKMGGKGRVPMVPASSSKDSKGSKGTGRPLQRNPKKRITADEIQSALDSAIFQLKMSVRGQAPLAVFKQLDSKQNGMVTPMEFSKFVQRTVQGMSKAQVGGLWRLADRNCDGKLDFQEFCDLLAFRP
ncbi:unnamed protein product [Symbiodinium natans]|uniref:Casein kinase I n=1 Tax=Symbiodinium natans TaxID=878477 RepID=A0A812HEW8_9DINO|nr:unnamed protein product [Symbiodinium natans]